MRLLSLDLERYGSFTGRRLAFRPDARLHVVLGPNEAGKSSALAAVTDLFFGIEERTRYDFLHKDEGLRIGAEITARDGRPLAFFRRKGRKNLLSDPSGAALPDDALGPFLGGMTRQVFCNAFGMNAAMLRRGAEEMLKSDGEVGASLFAAASGLRGYRDLARDLDEEATQIYAPRAQKRTLTLAIEAYDAARKEAGAGRLGAEAWRKLLGDLAGADERLDAIRERRRTIASEISALRRLRTVAPILRDLDGLAAEADELAGLVEMDEAGVAELARLGVAAEGGQARLADAEAALERAARDLREIEVDEGIAPHEAAIRALVEGVENYRQLGRDLPRIASEAGGFAADLAQIATRLGLDGPDAVAAGQPTDAARASLKTLLAAGRERAAEATRTEAELARQRIALRALETARDERGALVDPGPVRRGLARLEPALREVARRDDLADEVARDAREVAGEVARLSPPIASPEALASLALPSDATIRRFGAALDAATRRLEAARADLVDLRVARDATTTLLATRGAAGAVPDPAALASLRAERDRAFAGTRAAALAEPQAPSGAALLTTVAAFERAQAAADALADRLVADAARAAEHAADLRALDAQERDVGRAEAERAAAEAASAGCGRDWEALWTPLAIAPLPPAEMAAWRQAATALVARVRQIEARRSDLSAIVERIEALRPNLAVLADRLGLDGPAGLDAALVAAEIRARLHTLTETWDAARETVTRIATARESIGDGEAALVSLRESEAAWRTEWEAALRSAALPAGTGLEAAAAALDAWADVPAVLKEHANRTARVAGIRRDMAAYEADLGRVLEALAVRPGPSIRPGPSAVESVRHLQERSAAARDALVKHETRAGALADAERARHDATADAEGAARALADLLARHDIPDGTDRQVLSGALETRVKLRAETRRAQAELLRAGDAVPEAELRAGLAATGLDEIEGRLAALAAEEEARDHEGREVHAERGRLDAERRRVEAGTGAELAAAAKATAEVEIRSAARRYVVLKLGAMLLGAAVERHRAGQQDPLLRRAGELFAGLTGGGFASLGQFYDADDQPILKGRRAAGGRPVGVDEMSEGTQDQLFLALRLAYLEDFAGRAEPAPFVGDDIFASFDDVRTGHGLEALAAIGHHVQPILFTHHASVAELATRRLGAAVDVIELR